MKNRLFHFALAAAIFGSVGVSPSKAQVIPVVNSDFSSPDVSDPSTPGLQVDPYGSFVHYAPGWSVTGDGGVFRPTNPGLAFNGPLPTPQVGYVNAGVEMSQILGASLTPGLTYTLSLDIISRINVPTPAGYNIELLAGSTALINAFPAQVPPNSFSTLSFSYTAPTVGAPSGPLEILFSSPADQLDFTDVAVVAVPEPSTWSMMILGFCGVGLMSSRCKSKPAFRYYPRGVGQTARS